MKKAHLKELSHQLLGSMTDHPDALEYFATDGSIFRVVPSGVIYPANTADVRKTVQFVAERTAAGKPLSIIPRGKGTDDSGASIGEGLQMVFPPHMNKLLRLDARTVTVQPGILYGTLQQTLHTHGRFLPPYPEDIGSATLGGAVANNSSGEKSLKYGATRKFVKGLKVVLADGSLIETNRLSARELNRKKGQHTLEGEIYRKFDSLLLDNADVIAQHKSRTNQNTAGYALEEVRGKDGSFDLTQVFIGAEGTLGVMTEITLKTMPYNPRTTLVVGYLPSLSQTGELITALRKLGPSALEMVNYHLLEYLRAHRPADITGFVPDDLPSLMLFIEFDDASQLTQKFQSVRAARILARYGGTSRSATDPIEQVGLWKIRRSAPATLRLHHGPKKAPAFIDDAIVPIDQLAPFLDKTYKLLKKHDVEFTVWGHAGDGNLHVQPVLNPTKKKEVEKLYSLSHEFYALVIALGGSTSGSQSDGMLRAPYLSKLYGPEMMELFVSTKHIFDPESILNPLKKTQATEAYAREHIWNDYLPSRPFEHI